MRLSFLCTVCLCLYTHTGIAQSFKEFKNQIQSIYKSMTFSGMDLTVTDIPLIDSPSGIAFAQFNSTKNKRLLLLNHKYFYQRYRNSKGQLTDAGEDIIRGAIAHEWSHHFLGHTFERNSVILERNADIVAGRIMYEYITEKRDSNNKIKETDLSRALRVDTLFGQKGTRHLSRELRRIMMRKGFLLGLIIDYKRNPDLANPPLDNLVKLKIQDRKYRIDTLIYRLQKDYLKIATSNLATLVSTTIPHDTLTKQRILQYKEKNLPSSRNRDMAQWFLPLAIPDTLAAPATTILLNVIRQYNQKRDSILARSRPELDSRVIRNLILSDSITIETEALYNLGYLGPTLARNKDIGTILNSLSRYNSDSEKAPILTFKLIGGVTFILHQNNSPVTLEYNGIRAVFDSTKRISKPELFKYEFFSPSDKSRYFIDRNYHLWTETIGARNSLDNKIFLQPNHLYLH